MRKNSLFIEHKVGLLFIWLTDFRLLLYVLGGYCSSLKDLYQLSYTPVHTCTNEISTLTSSGIGFKRLSSRIFNPQRNEKK